MKIPSIQGVIRRRLLLNYRVAPEVVNSVLPRNFRPKLVHGHAIAGICLIRLEKLRPRALPSGIGELVGVASENSAHRIAVEWEGESGEMVEGVFVPRRDTDSRFNALVGGRVFPGVHHYSEFLVDDRRGQIHMQVNAADQKNSLVDVVASETESFPSDSIFGSLDESSQFFEAGCIGYSSRFDSCVLEGLRLKIDDWQASPLAVDRVASSYFDDRSLFPEDSIQFDHALLMRNIPHEWHSEPNLTAE